MVQIFSIQAWIGGLVQLALCPLILFLAAGTIAWPACWIFLLLFYSFVLIVVRRLARRDPVLLEERMSVFKATSRRDRMFLLLVALALAWLLVMPLDVMRFRWSHLPLSFQVIGVVTLAASFAIMYLVFRANAYVTPTVRVQQERGQTVVSTGPYRYMRHPMYTGFHLFFLGLSLLLGSIGGLVLTPLLIAIVVWRAVLEERLLREELPGYASYMGRVRFRFIPYLW